MANCRILAAFFLIFPGIFALWGAEAGAATSLKIIGPPSTDTVLPNTRYTFLIHFAYTGLFDLTYTDLRLDVTTSGGTFSSARGTSTLHFPTLPDTGGTAVSYRDSNGCLADGHAKFAVATVETAGTGTLEIQAAITVDGSTTNAIPVSAAIQGIGGGTSEEALFQLAMERQGMAFTYVQMYKNYMEGGDLYSNGVNREDLASELAGLASLTGGVIQAAETIAGLASNPGIALYSIFLELVGNATGQPNMMDVLGIMDTVAGETLKELYHTFYGGGHVLVQLETDITSGYLDRLAEIQGKEAAAWNFGRYRVDDPHPELPTIFEALKAEEAELNNIKTCSLAVAAAARANQHDVAEAFFTTLSNYATREKAAIPYIRQAAYLSMNQSPVFQDTPFSPGDAATSVAIHTDLSWSCTDPDGHTVLYEVYLKKASDASFQKITVTPIAATSFDPGTLETNMTYNWYVQARDTGIGDYNSNGPAVNSPTWSFTTVPDPLFSFLALYVPATGQVDKPLEADAIVLVNGTPAELRFELWVGGSFLKSLGNPVTVNSDPEPQHFSVVFSHASPVNAVVKAFLSSGGVDHAQESSSVTISEVVSSSPPALVQIQVQGTGRDGTPYFYDAGPITISFLTWDNGNLADIRCWMQYGFSVSEPATWAPEVELIYQGTEECDFGGGSMTVARHSHTIPATEFGLLADGKKALWIKPTRFEDETSILSGLDRAFNLAENPIRDDDTQVPEILLEGQDADGTPSYMVLTPRRLDFSVHVSDPMIIKWIDQSGNDYIILDAASGFSEIKFGYALTDEKTSSMEDGDFLFFFTHAEPIYSLQRDGYLLIPELEETRWLTFRALASEADNDWAGDEHVVRKDWTGQIPDDDPVGPEITNVVYPASADYDKIIPVSCAIADRSGLAVNPSNFKEEARIYWSFDKKNWGSPMFYNSSSPNLTYDFTILAPGSDHIGKTLYFYVEAIDGDNDRPGDGATAVADNDGQYYAIQIVDNDLPTIENLSIVEGSLVSGDVVISAQVADGSGTAQPTVRINGRIVSHSLPFTWNTLIPSWSTPVTVAPNMDGWGFSMTAGNGRELWVAYLESGNLYVLHSPDGITWDEPVLAVSPQDTIMRPALSRDSAGRLWLAYQDYDQDFHMTLHVTCSSDSGQTWTPPVAATTGIDVVGYSLIEDTNHTFWYAFYSYDEVDWKNIICVISSSDGINWSAPRVVDANPDWDVDYFMPVIASTPAGTVNLFYAVTSQGVVKSTSTTGTSWSARTPVTLEPQGTVIEPGPVLLAKNAFYWFTYMGGGRTYLAPSRDLTCWGAPVVVADHAMAVALSQSGDGTFWIATMAGSDLQVFHSVQTNPFTITLEATDASGNMVSQQVQVTVDNQERPYTLEDLIKILQILSGSRTTTSLLQADVNGDNRIGMVETLYVLQRLAEM